MALRMHALVLVSGVLAAGVAACGGAVVIGDGPGGDATVNGPEHGAAGADAGGGRVLSDSGTKLGAPTSDGGGDASQPPIRDGGQTSVPDVVLPPLDAALASLTPPPPGLAGFAFIVNNEVQHPMACPTGLWEFAAYPASSFAGCELSGCPGVESALLVNTGTLPMPYLVGKLWSVGGGDAQPGVAGSSGGLEQIAGVLEPGGTVAITSTYVESITALLGSAEPFSSPDAGVAVTDEGTIFWPAGVVGSGGATVMHVAEIEVFPSCQAVEQVW
jgi:hypothetical protein